VTREPKVPPPGAVAETDGPQQVAVADIVDGRVERSAALAAGAGDDHGAAAEQPVNNRVNEVPYTMRRTAKGIQQLAALGVLAAT